MNRFKTSKYKNTTPKIPKKDGWIANVRGGSFSSQGKHMKSSCSLVAFNTDQAGGGMVGLSSVNAASDGKWIVTQISCHADLVTDLDFSPFDDYLLATCSADETVKLWRVCDLDQDQPSNAEVTLSAADGRLEIVLFHPAASGLLAVASARGVQVWDVTRDTALTGKHTPSVFIPITITALNTRSCLQLLYFKCSLKPYSDANCFSSLLFIKELLCRSLFSLALVSALCPDWLCLRVTGSSDGHCVTELILTSHLTVIDQPSFFSNVALTVLLIIKMCFFVLIFLMLFLFLQDKKLRLFDPRAQPSAVQCVQGHQGNRDSRVLWVKDDNLLTTGFNQMRQQEVRLWDSRKLSSSLSSLSLATSNATLMPLFDPDSGLLIVSGNGESVIDCFEVNSSEPFLSQVSHCLTDVSTRGVALVPKLALDVSCCEVLRLMQLSDNFIVPISYQVPRKAGQDFHADLYPDTVGHTPAVTAEDWWKGENKQVERVSLHPSKRPKPAAPSAQETKPKDLPRDKSKEASTSSSPLSTPSSSAAPSRSPSSTSGLSSGFLPSPSPSQSSRAIHSMLGPSSKFRHIQGAVLHRDTHITNLRGLHLTTPGECDGFCANGQRVAVPLAIAGGQIAVFELSQPGKLPDTALPTIQNSVNVADFCWDPFDTHKLVVAGDDAKIRVWQIPKGGLTETLTEPERVLRGHTEKIYSIKFHPHASGLLASSSYDLTVRLWNLETGEEVKRLSGHQDQIFGMAWSPDGKLLATVCKDGKVRLYDPRKSTLPIQEGPGPEGQRGARVVWVCDGKYLLVSGFDSRSERQLYLFSAESLASGSVASAPADVSPSTLIPFYDPDTSVLILTGKGDTRVYIYEIVPEAPYFMECSSFHSSEPHKGLCFLPKAECDVRDVEVARAIRLGKTTIEPVAFRVPRVKKEFFQDDVFPETAVWWDASLTAAAWLSGSNGQHRKISLRPNDMTPVSEAPKEAPVRKYLPSSVYLEEKTDEQKKEELLSAMVAKLGNREDPLPQESYEGVDEDEWDD
ncbi:coronin-7 [Cyprinus carpio]|uniref:Coronin n=1 Tax=Cyprinus carpio TaxID=7962 RepID=A0A9Q9W5N4_CYPCA|nr:coronin-7 [Cyprinus carpio]